MTKPSDFDLYRPIFPISIFYGASATSILWVWTFVAVLMVISPSEVGSRLGGFSRRARELRVDPARKLRARIRADSLNGSGHQQNLCHRLVGMPRAVAKTGIDAGNAH